MISRSEERRINSSMKELSDRELQLLVANWLKRDDRRNQLALLKAELKRRNVELPDENPNPTR